MALHVGAGSILGGRYALDREIGRGGTASVFLARDLRQHRDVAVKILRPDVAVALGPDRFLREIDIASRLTHPHVLPVHDCGSGDAGAEGLLYYVMPFVEGESLRERLRREPRLPLDEALRITREVADALAYAHARNVVHRDIKPGNILLQAGHAVVADFGVARAISAAADDRVTSTGLVLGTPIYMSPEQASGESIDGRADIYALGCVAYEMLAGTPPFTGATPQEVAARHRSAPLRPLRLLRPEVPPPVAAAIERALAKLPEGRHADALAFARALQAPGGWGPAVPRGRRPLVLALTAIVVAAAVAVLVRSRTSADVAGPLAITVLPLQGDTLQPRGTPSAGELFAELIAWIPGLRVAPNDGVVAAGQDWRNVPEAQWLRRAAALGSRYVLAGSVLPGTTGPRVTIDLFATVGGERLVHAVDSATGPELERPVGRLAAAVVTTVARREGLELGSAGAVLAATNVLPAVGHMLQAQGRFWADDLDAAAEELRQAIEADSSCGLAYQRLSVVQAWRHDYPAALAIAEAGLRRSATFEPRWRQLLEAQRYLVLGYGDSAIATYQSAVLDHRDDIDAWLGLGEALVHHGGFAGASPRDARPAFERVVALDSTFAPVYDHLVDLAVYDGDAKAARAFLAHIRPDRPLRPGKAAEVALRFGARAERAAALDTLRSADRQVISEFVISTAHAAFNLPLADTAAGFLLGRDRVPDDRLRGAQYRLALAPALGRWRDAYATWDSVAGDVTFDPWLVQAALAGAPVGGRAEPMYAWARAALREGPDFSLPPWDERRQGFEALVYHATLSGDSAEVRELLRRIDGAQPPDPAEPAPGALAASMRARLALLAADTVGAIAELRRAVARIPEVYTANHPLTAVAPQRFLLAQLLLARGDTAGAERWRRSFLASWSVADMLYRPRLDSLGVGPSRPRTGGLP